MKVSNRVNKMEYSAIRKLNPIANATKAKGITVNHLNIGVPDAITPPQFLAAIKDYNEKTINYADAIGILELRLAISKFFSEIYDLDFKESEIAVTNGASEALLLILMTVCDYGDNVITTNPYYSNYKSYFDQTGVNLKVFETELANDFNLPAKSVIESQIDNKTKAMLICNPGNPTGKVYSENELQVLVEIAKENNLYIIADEIYRDFLYDNITFTSFADFNEVEDQVIIIDSVSKRFSACGVRIGAILSKNPDLMAAIFKLATARLASPTLEQVGATALYNLRDDYLEDVSKVYQRRKDLAYQRLLEIDDVIVKNPEGAFYIMAKLPITDSYDFVKWLLTDFSYNNETVMLAFASGFYQGDLGSDEVRIAFAVDDKILVKSLDLLDIALKQYRELGR